MLFLVVCPVDHPSKLSPPALAQILNTNGKVDECATWEFVYEQRGRAMLVQKQCNKLQHHWP